MSAALNMSAELKATRVRVLAFGVGALLLLAACGGSTASPSASSAVTVPASPIASPAASGSLEGTTEASPSAEGSTAASPPASATCTPPADPTTSQTEGPYFTAGSPERASLREAGMDGQSLLLTGFVVTIDCEPIAGAKVDIWQADASGVYDNSGYRLRGHVFTDETGRYAIETIVPGEYPGRTEHIHVKITPPGGATLTSQLYFPDAGANEADGIFRPELLLDIVPATEGLTGTFTFALA